jgi:hypothetical protein
MTTRRRWAMNCPATNRGWAMNCPTTNDGTNAFTSFPNSCFGNALAETPFPEHSKRSFRQLRSQTGVCERGGKTAPFVVGQFIARSGEEPRSMTTRRRRAMNCPTTNDRTNACEKWPVSPRRQAKHSPARHPPAAWSARPGVLPRHDTRRPPSTMESCVMVHVFSRLKRRTRSAKPARHRRRAPTPTVGVLER